MNWLNHDLLEGAGVVLSIFLIIFLVRKGWKMYRVLFLATLILAVTNGNSAGENLSLLWRSLTSSTAFFLVAMVITITMLSRLHRQTGAMEQLVGHLRSLIRDTRVLLIVLPAITSLLTTVPGGAIVSAPMVEETGRKLKLSPIELAMANIVFRHLIVLINPFNASLILASGITGIAITGYLKFTVPVVAAVMFILVIYVLKKYPAIEEERCNGPLRSLGRLAVTASPYLLAMVLGLGFGIYFPLAMLAAVGAAFFINLPREGTAAALRTRIGYLWRGINWSLALSTLGIVFYMDYMLEADSFLQAVQYLLEQGLPLAIILIIFPFLTGFITGHNAASLGIALPVLLPLLGPEMLTIKHAGIIYLSSYAGYLGSPVHYCTYLTIEYFHAPMFPVIKKMNAYGLGLLAIGLIVAMFY